MMAKPHGGGRRRTAKGFRRGIVLGFIGAILAAALATMLQSPPGESPSLQIGAGDATDQVQPSSSREVTVMPTIVAESPETVGPNTQLNPSMPSTMSPRLAGQSADRLPAKDESAPGTDMITARLGTPPELGSLPDVDPPSAVEAEGASHAAAADVGDWTSSNPTGPESLAAETQPSSTGNRSADSGDDPLPPVAVVDFDPDLVKDRDNEPPYPGAPSQQGSPSAYDGSPKSSEQPRTVQEVPASATEPNSPPRPANVRPYTVRQHDTLFGIALRELGDARRWTELYRLNRDRVGDNFGTLPVGLKLMLPLSDDFDSQSATSSRRPLGALNR